MVKLLAFTCIFAADLRFEQISLQEGLSYPAVWSICQDSYGFMWFGTHKGLNKFDGYKFTTYYLEDSTGLESNIIWVLYEDSDTILWVGTLFGGLFKYNPYNDSFKQYVNNPNDDTSLGNNSIRSLFEDSHGNFWVGTQNGFLNKMDRKTGHFNRIQIEDARPEAASPIDNYINTVCEDSSGNLWIGTNQSGLVKMNLATGELFHYLHDNEDKTSISSNSIWSLSVDKNNVLWIGTKQNGLNRYDEETESFLHFFNPKTPSGLFKDVGILCILQGQPDVLWLGTEYDGLIQFNSKTEQYYQYKVDLTDPYCITDNSIWSLFKDQTGVIWIGTHYSGIFKFDQTSNGFMHYKSEPGYINSISNNTVWAICEDHVGDLWIGTFDGLNRYDKKTKQYEQYFHQPDNPTSLSMNYIKSIYEDYSGILWIGTFIGGLNKYNRESNSFETIEQTLPDVQFGHDINDLLEDSFNAFWIGNGLGLYKFDREKNQFHKYLANKTVYTIYEDSKRNLWIGTDSDGLYRYNRERDIFKSVKFVVGENHRKLRWRINCIAEAKNDTNTLWIGTGTGLKLINYDSGFYKECDAVNNKLYDKEICGIFYDSKGNIWLSTSKVISRYCPSTNKVDLFDSYDGAKGNAYSILSPFQSSSGKLYFGSYNGYTVFHPDSIRLNEISPKLALTGLKINNKPFKTSLDLPHVSLLQELHLKYNQNDIEIEFAALHYSAPAQNQYAYMLEGYDTDWISTDAVNRYAKYTNLDPGHYQFQVKGSNNDGIWNEDSRSMTIIITPPWWETTLAYVVYILLIGGVLLGGWRFQVSRLKLHHQVEIEHLEAERYQEMDTLKSRFFANISHEFRTPLTLILGPIDKLRKRFRDKDSQNDLSLMQKHAKRLLNLVSQLLDITKLEARKMTLRASPGDIIPLIKGLVQSFVSLADRKDVSLSFPFELETLEVYFQKDVIVKIMNNLLSNAFKFTNPGDSITITLTTKDVHQSGDPDTVVISVSDTGIGIPADRLNTIFDRFYQVDDSHTRKHEGTGIGLSLTKELVELQKGTITVESQEDCGSTFTIQFPLGRDHLKAEEIVESMPDSETDIIEPGFMIDIDDIDFKEEKSGSTATWESTWEILIVEDNTDVRRYIREYIEHDYHIIEAQNGKEGFVTAIQKIPDLIISDIMMPVMDGIEFCRQVKNDERTSHIPVILLTAKADLDDKLDGLETGADDYLTKPFDARELKIRIRNLIDQRRRLQERFKNEFSVIPEDISLASLDEQFLNKVVEVVRQNLSDPDFKVDEFARQVYMSRQHLNRKLKALTGYNPGDFIRSIRLKSAAQLLQQHEATVTEIAYQVGFASPSRLSDLFHQEFGCTPSQYSKGHTK